MRENIKTAWFVGLALVIGVGAFVTRPVPHKKHKGEDTPVELFPELKDPLDVTGLEIVQFDEASQQCKKPFEVSQVTGRDGKSRWVIPSHSDYPADAKDHLAEAATLLMGIKSVNTAPGMGEEVRTSTRPTFAGCTTSTASSIPIRPRLSRPIRALARGLP